MSDEYLTRNEHHEFVKRMDAENQRLSHRITTLENTVQRIQELTLSVKEIDLSIKQVMEEIKKQGERLTLIEQKPGKRWEALVTGILGAIAGAIGAAIAAGIIH